MSRSFHSFSRTLSVCVLAMLALAQAPPAQGTDSDHLVAMVPSSAAVIVSTNHSALSKHPHYFDVLRFLVSRGWGSGLEALSSAGVNLATDAGHTVTYRTAGGGEGLLLKLASTEALRKRLAVSQGASYDSSDKEGYPTFTLTQRLRVHELGGGVLLVASSTMAKRTLAAIKKKKVMSKKRGFSKLASRARSLGDGLWGVAYVPTALRARMTDRGTGDIAGIERVVFGAKGVGPSTLKVEATAKSPVAAEEARAAIRSKIERKVLSSAVLRALGVGVLVEQLKLSTQGARLDAKMTLTAPQVGLLSRLAKRLVGAL